MRPFSSIVLITLVALTAFMAFLWYANDLRLGRRIAFKRVIANVKLENAVELPFQQPYFAGVSNSRLYISALENFFRVQVCKFDLTIERSFYFGDDVKGRVAWRALRVSVDSPDVYFTEGITPALLTGRLGRKELRLVDNHPKSVDRFLSIGRGKYLAIAFDVRRKVNEVIKSSISDTAMLPFSSVLEKQVDGVFCVDGFLTRDYLQDDLYAYTYFYRNQFMIFNSRGEVLDRARTIDTVSRVNFDTARLSPGNVSINGPSTIVNRQSCLDNRKLYIWSTAITSDTKGSTEIPIDVYNALQGNYIHTYYLNEFEGLKPSSFLVSGDRLFALYANYLVAYRLSI